MTLTVRIAADADAGAVVALVDSAYRGEESRQGWTTEADLLGGQRTDVEMVRDLVRDPAGVVLLAEDGPPSAGLVACCHLERRARTARLGMFAVRPGRQGGGVGRWMLGAATDHATEVWGAERVEITVLAQRTELIAWYERCGFTLTGERHPFPYGDPRYGLPHRDDLELLAMARPVGSNIAPG
ncbi:N-acetyltransferase [Actinotalea sp. K2]|uniref:GNAT family N-acetyltransferase n=1 Tax=Actinotalea sp. K2 TaxID=2939438 RepID=UPI0020172149|nr:GNAT family N-acetyltransferase [Actinotalea sp. K2]MCL3861428.1 GNAT family N-acetyltransferase [Actinotalea sp. K2]